MWFLKTFVGRTLPSAMFDRIDVAARLACVARPPNCSHFGKRAVRR
jgi:hypothetical protein